LQLVGTTECKPRLERGKKTFNPDRGKHVGELKLTNSSGEKKQV